jgi:predicted Fe-S protein YdhL (DUF1289 family)
MNQEISSRVSSANHVDLLKKIQTALISMPIGSPCINICKLDEFTRTFCTGCLRPRAEIKAWKTLDDAEKRVILLRLADEIKN